MFSRQKSRKQTFCKYYYYIPILLLFIFFLLSVAFCVCVHLFIFCGVVYDFLLAPLAFYCCMAINLHLNHRHPHTANWLCELSWFFGAFGETMVTMV